MRKQLADFSTENVRWKYSTFRLNPKSSQSTRATTTSVDLSVKVKKDKFHEVYLILLIFLLRFVSVNYLCNLPEDSLFHFVQFTV